MLVCTAASAFITVPSWVAIRPAAAQTFPKRKNIDSLTAIELDDYKYAVGILKQRSSTDPTRQEGYIYQASLHNRVRVHADGSVGACEHGSEQFFPWHRPHLAGFEKLLRDSDPPRTANVTIPYWDWTKAPSGRMVAAAFEDQTSPLFNSGRRNSGDPPMWDGDDIRDMVREPQWDLFAGRPKGPNSSYGAFEQSPHNTMHPAIGSTMANPSTAANDPIYWSFHAYIDLVWARWQRLHRQIFACGSCKLWLEPNSYTVDQMATTRDWNYEYDYDFEQDGPPVVAAAGGGTSAPLPFVESTNRSATADLVVSPNDKRQILKIQKVLPLADASYRIQVYVHPADVKPESLTEQQRQQYLVRTVTIWMSAGHHPEASDVLVDLTRALAQPGNNRRVSVVIEGVPSGDAAPSPLTQPLPALQGLLRGLAVEEH
jgi:tyrosinase